MKFPLSLDWISNLLYGFFVIVLTNGDLMYSDFVTSKCNEGIFPEHLETALFDVLSDVDAAKIDRIQFYHTHPNGPSARSLSTSDVDEILRWRELLKTRGIRVPLDIHAMPYELAFEGYVELGNPPERMPVVPVSFRITVHP